MKNAPFSHAAWYMPSLVLLMQLATCLLVSFSGSMDDRLTAADGKHRRRALMTLVHVSSLIKCPFTQSFMPTWTLTQVTFLDCWTRLDRLEIKLVTVKPGDYDHLCMVSFRATHLFCVQTIQNRVPNVQQCCVWRDSEALVFVTTMVMFVSSVAGFGRIALGVAVSRVLWSSLWCFLPDSVNRLRFRCSTGRRCVRGDLFELAVVALFPIFVQFKFCFHFLYSWFHVIYDHI